MRNSLVLAVVILLAAVGCKDKARPTDQAPGAGTGGAPAAPFDPAPADVAKLAAGEATFGCIAWSERTKSAACITGETGSTGTEYTLTMIGGGPGTITLVPQSEESDAKAMIDDAAAAAANAALAKDAFAPLAGAAQKLEAAKPTDAGAAKLLWTTKETPSTEDNTAPTYDNKLTATCAGKEVELFHVTGEGVSVEPATRTAGAHVIVEAKTHRGLEGEYADGFAAVVLDPASCTVFGKI